MLLRTPKGKWADRLMLRRSFSGRVAVTLALLLALLLVALGVFVATQLQSQMFMARKNLILEDAGVRFTQVQSQMVQSTASTEDQVQELTANIVTSTGESAAGAGAISVMMLRSERASEAFFINEFSDADLIQTITPELRKMVVRNDAAWQSIEIPGKPNGEPGIAAGALLEVPLAGEYEFYIIYSLESEQNTVVAAMRIFTIASIPLAVVMTGATFLLIFRTLRPVRHTAAAAEKLAAGELETRVSVSGQDEMARLGDAFNDMADSLQNQISEYGKLSELQQRFVSDVSHELRTPLTTIRMAEELIYDDRYELDPAPKRSAELLHSEVGRLESMLADLLEISRYDAQSTTLDWEAIDIYGLVERVVDANAELAEHLGVEVEVSERPERVTAEADGKRIERVVRNLLVNAFEHAEGKPVKVVVDSSEHSLAISVQDHGVGMSEETMSRVFDRFYRADPSRTRTTGGTGLGLAIAKEDVAAHNGQIHVDAALGEGTIFVVTIPRKAGDPVFEFPLVARLNHEA